MKLCFLVYWKICFYLRYAYVTAATTAIVSSGNPMRNTNTNPSLPKCWNTGAVRESSIRYVRKFGACFTVKKITWYQLSMVHVSIMTSENKVKHRNIRYNLILIFCVPVFDLCS